MARRVEDLVLAMYLLAGEDGLDFTAPPVPLMPPPENLSSMRVAFFTDNGFASCSSEVEDVVRRSAHFLSEAGMHIEERRPPGVERAYELELAIAGADGGDAIDEYLQAIGSTEVHPLLTDFLNRLRPFRSTASQLSARWTQWDQYRSDIARFFDDYDAVLCPVYSQPALKHGQSAINSHFEGFSYTMAWNMAGTPAATVRCGAIDNLPLNVQVVTRRWRDLLSLEICHLLETQFGGWQPPPLLQMNYLTGTNKKDTGDGT
jgi:amidase